MGGMIVISRSLCLFLHFLWPRKYNSRAIYWSWTVDKGKYTLSIILFVLLQFYFFPYSLFGYIRSV